MTYVSFDSLSGDSSYIKQEFLEREVTPELAMKLSVRLYLAELLPSDSISIFAELGINRYRTTVHRWVQKADLQPAEGQDPNYVAVDESVIRVNDERYWLFAAVDPDTNHLLHVRLFPTRNPTLTEMFLVTPRETSHQRRDLSGQCRTLASGGLPSSLTPIPICYPRRSNAVECVFKQLKRRTEAFASHFRHADLNKAETWLQVFSVCFNQLI
jgi:transposase-like protein